MNDENILGKLILGINDSHDSSACLVRNGEILCAVAEERIQRVKSASGFPAGAVRACLDHCGATLADVDYVAVAGNWGVPVNLIGLRSSCGIRDYIDIQEKVRRPYYYEGRRVALAELFPDFRPSNDVGYPLDKFPLKETWELGQEEIAKLQSLRLDYIGQFLSFPRDKIFTLDHHTCHAYFAYYSSAFRERRVAALTMDGGGDRIYDSVGVFDERGNYSRIRASHDCLIGPMYKWVTLLLGMRPGEHEYKLMGLAPYAKEHTKRRSREIFERLIQLDGIAFSKATDLKDLYWDVKDRLKYERFDGIAGGLQDAVESLLTRWVVGALATVGADHAVFAGGVAMNVKANKSILEQDAVKGLFVPPGAGDESLCIGAAWALMDHVNPSGDHRPKIGPLANAYLGPELDRADTEEFANHPLVRSKFRRCEGSPQDHVARALLNDEIVAVCQGRMEFGPRALGHRSIIANPGSLGSVRQINEAIKNRDFWMPFAPSILAGSIAEYLRDPGKMDLSYMTVCLESLPPAKKAIPAGLHAYDETARQRWPRSLGQILVVS
jgi:carbamoyltransferase